MEKTQKRRHGILMEGTFSIYPDKCATTEKTSQNYLISNFKIDSWCMLCGNFLRGKNLESGNAWDLEKNEKYPA